MKINKVLKIKFFYNIYSISLPPPKSSVSVINGDNWFPYSIFNYN